MKKFWLLALLCCVCAAAISCNDDDEVVADDNEGTASQTASYGLTGSHGFYYGDSFTEGTTVEYYILLSDKDLADSYQAGGQYYFLSLHSTAEPASGTITIPEGTYTVSDTDGNNAIYSEDSYYLLYDSEKYYFSSGSLTVSVSGTTTTIEGTLTDEAGNTYSIRYSGAIEISDYSFDSDDPDSNSTFTEDITPDMTGADCYAYYYGDDFGTGSVCWWIQIYKYPGSGFNMTYCGDSSFTFDSGLLPTGEYTGADAIAEGNYVKGKRYGSYLDDSWYMSQNSLGFVTNPFSPLGSGTFTVTYNEQDGTYTFEWDVMDESDTYSIKTSWTGTPTLTDYTAETSSVSSQSLKSAAAVSARPVSGRFAVRLNNPAFGKADLR